MTRDTSSVKRFWWLLVGGVILLIGGGIIDTGGLTSSELLMATGAGLVVLLVFAFVYRSFGSHKALGKAETRRDPDRPGAIVCSVVCAAAGLVALLYSL